MKLCVSWILKCACVEIYFWFSQGVLLVVFANGRSRDLKYEQFVYSVLLREEIKIAKIDVESRNKFSVRNGML